METIDRKSGDDQETQSLDELALRMTAYHERAIAARRLAEAISDKRATTGLLAHAQAFEKKAEEIAAEIVLLAHLRNDGVRRAADSAEAGKAKASQKPR
jgi:hypothetical protein